METSPKINNNSNTNTRFLIQKVKRIQMADAKARLLVGVILLRIVHYPDRMDNDYY